MGADVADLVGVYNFSAFRDLRLVREKDGFGAGDALAFRVGFPTPMGRSILHLLEL